MYSCSTIKEIPITNITDIVGLTGVLTGCGNSAGGSAQNGTDPFADKDLADVINEIYDAAGEIEVYLGDPEEVDESMMSYDIGTEDLTGIAQVVASEPMMSSIPYSLCLIRVEDGADVKEIRQRIFDGANPRKWICVEAEKVTVNNAGNVILLLMADKDIEEMVYNAFVEVAGGNVGEQLIR